MTVLLAFDAISFDPIGSANGHRAGYISFSEIAADYKQSVIGMNLGK